ncbi:MAG: hypothetical protein ABIH26_15135 [Candidatus Eisenbacteria bacterium]
MDQEKNAKRLDAILSEVAGGAERAGGRGWRFTLRNGGSPGGSATLRGSWLLLDAPAGMRQGLEPVSVLLAHPLLPGAGKAVVADEESGLRLRAEIPLDRGVDVERWMMDTFHGFESFADVLDRVRSGNGGENRNPRAPSGTGPTEDRDGDAIRESVEEAGWRAEGRPDGTLSVDLETARGPRRAIITRLADGGVRPAARIARLEGSGGETLEAAALFLLSASASIRLVRPTLEREEGGGSALLFETRMHGSPTACEIDHALQALSVASRACGKEVPLFRSKRIASAYLESRGWAGGSTLSPRSPEQQGG